MRLHIIIYMLVGIVLCANAQTDKSASLYRGPVRFAPGSALLQTNPATGMAFQAVGSPFISTPIEEATSYYNGSTKDTTNISSNISKSLPHSKESSPKGTFQASVDLSVMAGFGKGAPKGAGFAQNIDFSYTTPLSKHTWLTAGGYLNHLNWSGINMTGAGLYGELGYQFDDHWSAYIYGQKSLVNSGVPRYGYGSYYGYWGYPGYYGYPGYNPFGDKLGAAVRWTPNPSFSIQLSVEKDWLPKSDFGYNRRYDYQKW